MQITEIISKEDLREPYDLLSDFLSIEEIIKIEQEYMGQQVKFKKNCADVIAEYPRLVLLIGKEKALLFLKKLGGGTPVYFPELKRNCRDKIKSLIISECNGYNHLQLARKYGYTERHIKNIVAGKVKRRPAIDENQLSLLDETV